ncbi:MAG: hypothetical protein UV73_C0005G0043 [Candidatus Gottesmanbacteria bacterium GW2011_GWA2_43_14]|uniref:Uncharacterized protein n=1 Tax=Candidatus Gottesmanbacteria bacterium GW2011_GWA2_43_14 TaxID=1618443 RepID=A0A0G1FRW4_9BACT|nr:MAG: hypothetical protein UV73_C0005G0043 [Candidatus Gottesmanbacteria bacterium GW2011_GWA2_43_14]
MLKKIFLKSGIIKELLQYLWKERLWWMIPMITVLILLGVLMVFAQSSPAAPFIYTLF